MKRWLLLAMGMTLLLLTISCVKNVKQTNAPDQTTAETFAQKGQIAFNQADYIEAIRSWNEAIRRYQRQKSTSKEIDLLILQARAYQCMGQYPDSIKQFDAALSLLENAEEDERYPIILQGIGQSHQFLGDIDKAWEYLKTARQLAEKNKNTDLQASLMNDQGNLLFFKRDYESAIDKYRKSLELATQAQDKPILVKANLNAAKSCYELKQYQQGINHAEDALKVIESLSDTHEKIYDQIALVKISFQLKQADNCLTRSSLAQIHDLLNGCLALAGKLNDPLAASYALGTLGELYENEKQYDDALTFTRQAVFEAQKCQSNECLMRWQWQSGRLLRRLNNLDGALMAYQQAMTSLDALRNDLFIDCKGKRLSFRDTVGPLYFETADCLLLRSGSTKDISQQQKDLALACAVIEKLKTAELQDYFQDECVTYLQSKIVNIEDISIHTAALYPVILPDRIELLLCLPGTVRQKTILFKSNDFITLVGAFRREVEEGGPDYKAYGQRLYRTLIEPLEADLKAYQINTFIVIPDGALRTIPFAALFDGEKFLVEKYAIVTTPGLNLTDPHPLNRDKISVLLAGLTEPVQGFLGLPKVSYELDGIQKICKGRVLKNAEFTAANLEASLAELPYPLIHIASHGQFNRDPKQTFLLTYDGRLSMEDLEKLMGLSRFRKEPVELLTLSACQTAIGDDQAALGLAGVALRAGARSAIASLWFVDDEATSQMMIDLYQELTDRSITKAEALRSSQIKMIHQERFSHPVYWAPFLLIGNWL